MLYTYLLARWRNIVLDASDDYPPQDLVLSGAKQLRRVTADRVIEMLRSDLSDHKLVLWQVAHAHHDVDGADRALTAIFFGGQHELRHAA